MSEKYFNDSPYPSKTQLSEIDDDLSAKSYAIPENLEINVS